MGKPRINIDLERLIYANFGPNGLKRLNGDSSNLKASINKLIAVKDKQQAINRFKWYNLPIGITGDLLERMLYYRGKIMFYYSESDSRFYALPFALDGGIDMWGRYNRITPVPFNGSTEKQDAKTGKLKVEAWIPGLTRQVQYDIILPEDLTKYDMTDKCTILCDRSLEISQEVIPRHVLNKEIIEVESEIIPFMRTSLLSATGINGLRVETEDDQAQVKMASASIDSAALNGEKWIPIVGNLEFQELTNSTVGKGEEFLEVLQSLDNFRLQTLGISNGGVFQKKAHMLQDEADSNQGNKDLVRVDDLEQRRMWCDITNSIWGLNIWVEPNDQDPDVQENDGENEPTPGQKGSDGASTEEGGEE